MQNRNSHLRLPAGLLSQHSHFAQLQARLKHLDSVVGVQMRALQMALEKISGRKGAGLASRTLEADSLEEELLDALENTGRRLLRSTVADVMRPLSSRASRGQRMSDLAQAISRSMFRDL